MNTTHFDYVIVGGGSAGCVLANRLSADPRNSVCLLEAGPAGNTPMVSTPGAFAYFMFSNKYNWQYGSKPESDIRDGKPVFVPRGKLLGGSSSVNAMVYIRGDRSDYDTWAELGNSGWSYDDVLPYFKKAETNVRGANGFHGDNGPLYVSDGVPHYKPSLVFAQAAQQAGFPYNHDFNGESLEGVGPYQFTIKDGQRCGALRAYLKPAMSRPNLTVLTEAPVSRILFEGKRASGVAFQHKGRTQQVTAATEVLLCGGAINSPQLLMLSGVGAANQLAEHNIQLHHELPGVGKNLQEHADACVLVRSKKRDGFTVSPGGLAKMSPETLKYMVNRSGKLSVSVTESGGFIKSSPEVDVPDVQLHFVPLLFEDSGRNLGLMAKHGYSLHACVLRPKSRGEIRLASGDPQDAPIVDYNFFSHPDDGKVMVNAIRRVREILAAPAFDPYRGEELVPGPEAQSDEAILAQAKKYLGTVYHPVGTCKMGSDTMAVVDDQLRVHGLEALRVVDASIMPTLISGNTNAPTIMIAEKAAEFILGARASATSEAAATAKHAPETTFEPA